MSIPVTFDFSGYRVLIAGGSKGIGRAIARAFAHAGAAVSVCARHPDGLVDVRHELEAFEHPVHTFAGDLSEAQTVPAWLQGAADALGGIDVLVNNASGYGFRDDDDDWAANFQVDLMAAVRASRFAEPWLKSSPHGSILHTSSISALGPRPSSPSYAAIKAALCQFTTSQALRLAKYDIRANAIAPGSIEFKDGLWDRCKRDKPDQYAATLAKIPFRRFGTPEEIANTALFLASPLASWITGQILSVDGGQSLNG